MSQTQNPERPVTVASVMEALREIKKSLERIEARQLARSTGGPQMPPPRFPIDINDPRFGDPVVKKDPKRWDGESFAGRHFSECTPEYLDCLSEFKDWQAKKDFTENRQYNGKPSFVFPQKESLLAAAWASELRKNPPQPRAKDPSWVEEDTSFNPEDFDKEF